MKILFPLTCLTLCSCSVFKNEYKYTTMYKLHTNQHITFNHHPYDCLWCNKDKTEAAKSMIAEKQTDISNQIL